MKRVSALLMVAMALSGCATSSKNIAASYTSPMQYRGYDCEQLTAEGQRIHARVSQLSGRLDSAADNDKWIVAAGVLVAWPFLFAVGGTKDQEAEYARLKGEHDAIMQTSTMKKCQANL